MIQFIFTFLPSTILGFIFIILGLKLKMKRLEKIKNGVTARVIDIKVNEKRSKDGYLKKEKYTLTLEYLYNNQLIKGNIDSIYDYSIGSEIIVQLYADKVAFILSSPSKNVTDNYNSLNLSGYMILIGIGCYLLIFTILGLILQLGSYVDEKYFSALVIIIILCLIGGVFISYLQKTSKILKDIKYLEYEKINAKIIDVKRHSKMSNNRTITRYYPVVQYDYDGKTYNKVIYEIKELHELNLGNEYVIYRHRRTGEIITEMAIKRYQFSFRIYFILIILILVGIILTMLSCI